MIYMPLKIEIEEKKKEERKKQRRLFSFLLPELGRLIRKSAS